MSLHNKHCKPCEDKDTPPILEEESSKLIEELDNWMIDNDKKLEKTLKFKDFKEALSFINQVGEIAEREGHHPDLHLFGYNKVKITLFTHSINGLTENDFILAAKIDELRRTGIKD